MEKISAQWISRGLIGGFAGVLLAAADWGALFQGGYSIPPLCKPLMDWVGLHWAAAVTFTLFFGLGAAAGVATLPFADSGRELVGQSLLHFTVTAGLWSAVLGGCFGIREPMSWLLGLGLLAVLYFLVWLGRWVGWYTEVASIREKLGLAPGPSLFHWKESLPYVGFAFLLCLILPTALRLLDARDVPVLSAVYGALLLPVGGGISGLSLGRRHGLCLLYPVTCVLFVLVFILTAKLYTNMADEILAPIALVSVLAGNLVGTAVHGMKHRKGGKA